MAKLSVFDPAMCCSTRVCGPAVDSVLPWFVRRASTGSSVRGSRWSAINLAQQPGAFAENGPVKKALHDQGDDCLPLILVMAGSPVSGGIQPETSLARPG